MQPGEVLVAENTDPDWEPVMRKVSAIVTDQGGRTAHAAIISREFGLPCIVGRVTRLHTANRTSCDRLLRRRGGRPSLGGAVPSKSSTWMQRWCR